MGLTKSAFTPALTRQMVWLAGVVPYDTAAQIFERIGKRLVSSTSIWEQVQRVGPQLQAYVVHQREMVNIERVVLPGHDLDIRRGVSLDGGMMHIRGEGWKEFKVGTVFDVAIHLERDPVSGELVEKPHAHQMTYTAVLGSPVPFAQALWHLAVEQQVPQAFHSSVTADGADWIWNLVADFFPDSVQILDVYHALQHLASAATALFPEQEDRAKRWFSQRKHHLFRGDIQAIIRPLEAAGLPEHARYFHVHKRRMQYQAFQEDLYPIGSGTVESAIKQFKARLSGAGMRWSRQAADVMLILRSAVLGHTFDTLWDAAL